MVVFGSCRARLLLAVIFPTLTMFFLRERNKEHEFVCIESLVLG